MGTGKMHERTKQCKHSFLRMYGCRNHPRLMKPFFQDDNLLHQDRSLQGACRLGSSGSTLAQRGKQGQGEDGC